MAILQWSIDGEQVSFLYIIWLTKQNIDVYVVYLYLFTYVGVVIREM